MCIVLSSVSHFYHFHATVGFSSSTLPSKQLSNHLATFSCHLVSELITKLKENKKDQDCAEETIQNKNITRLETNIDQSRGLDKLDKDNRDIFIPIASK